MPVTVIVKAKETMSAKQRVLNTFAYEKTDRVPIGYEANAAIHKKLCEALSISNYDPLKLYDMLGVDYCGIYPNYTGKKLFSDIKDRNVDPLEGFVMRWVEHETGGYMDFCDFPLKDADEEAFYKFPVPNPDDFDYDEAKERAKALDNRFALFFGGPGTPDIINANGRIMGMEDILCHLITHEEAAMDFVHRRVKWQLGMMERMLDKCEGLINFIWLGEDLGTQIAPMINPELYKSTIKPIHKMFVDLANSYNLPTLIHTCGSSSWAYEDFIEIGIKGVDTLQPEAVNMSPQYLVEHFGGRLNFRGCISTAGELAYGNADEVEKVCIETLEIMKPTKGYHFAPTHAIQDNSPVENVIRMYQTAHRHGTY